MRLISSELREGQVRGRRGLGETSEVDRQQLRAYREMLGWVVVDLQNLLQATWSPCCRGLGFGARLLLALPRQSAFFFRVWLF